MFSRIEDAIEDIKEGKFVIVLDDENRENEGDLVTAAESITGEKINFMIKHGRGLVCVPMCKERLEELSIGPMVANKSCKDQAAFTISVDHKDAGTGISAFDRALTIKKLADKNSKAQDFIRPGHIFPLEARCMGVLSREGHTEATIDLVKLAGFNPIGVLCEILNEDGSVARRDQLVEFGRKHNIKLISIEDLQRYIKRNK